MEYTHLAMGQIELGCAADTTEEWAETVQILPWVLVHFLCSLVATVWRVVHVMLSVPWLVLGCDTSNLYTMKDTFTFEFTGPLKSSTIQSYLVSKW